MNKATDQELKSQALLERVAALTTDYENAMANLRIQITRLTEDNKELSDKVEELSAKDEKPSKRS